MGVSPSWVSIAVSLLLQFGAGSVAAKDVLIVSDPPGANVVVDGRVLGKTPLNTTRKELMPGWASDGAMTSVSIAIELPFYETQTKTFGEWGLPKSISVSLVKKDLGEHFENYLQDTPDLQEQTIAASELRISLSDSLDTASADLFLQGYVLVAFLGVSAEAPPMELIRERGVGIGASVALVQSKSAGVKTEVRQVTTRSSGTVASTIGFGSASTSAGQTVFGSGNSFSFIPGRSSTQFVPFEQRQYDVRVAYWRKRKPNDLGVYTELIPADLRQTLQRNTGAYVVAVEEGSPAFLANLLVGDVIIALGGRPITTPRDVQPALTQTAENTIILDILRNGKPTQIAVKFF